MHNDKDNLTTQTSEKQAGIVSPLLSAVISDCTHLLACRHCIGRSCRDYYMNCIVLGETKNGKMKIIVFGERNWRGKEHIKRIKYVDKWKLYPKK